MKANIPDEKQDSYSLSEPTERVGVRFYKAFYENQMFPVDFVCVVVNSIRPIVPKFITNDLGLL
ncbi:MAG: hypothetical protein ACYT04_67765 [Nostoc sp.]